MINTLIYYFSNYPFIINAFIVAILTSICSSLLGMNLVLKRLAYIGDSLSHTAFGFMCMGSIISLNDNMIFVTISMIIVTIIIIKYSNKIKGDSLLALFSVSALGIGYFIMNVFNTSSNISGDVCTVLFGSSSILTLRSTDLYISIVLSIIIIIIYILYYNYFFVLSFDDNFSKVSGVNIDIYNNIFAIVLAIIIVLSIKLVGSLLISALIVFPALTCMNIFNSYFKATIGCIVFSLISTIIGMLIAILYGTPIGSTIIIINLFIYILSLLYKRYI